MKSIRVTLTPSFQMFSGSWGPTSFIISNHLLVILPDIPVRPVEQLRILVQLVLEQGLAQRDLHLTLTCMGVLPAVEPDLADDLVDVVDDPLDHDGCLAVLRFLEQLRKRSLAAVDLFLNRHLAFQVDDISGEFQQFLEEVDALEQAVFVAILQILSLIHI